MHFDSRSGSCSSRRRHARSLSDLVNVVRSRGTRTDLRMRFGRRFCLEPLPTSLQPNYTAGIPSPDRLQTPAQSCSCSAASDAHPFTSASRTLLVGSRRQVTWFLGMIDTVRLLLWNVGLGPRRGPTDAAMDWLDAADWDVAVLLEVDGPGLARLEATTWKLAVGGPPRGRALSTALAAKGRCGALDPIDAPTFDTRDGLYRYRVAVARVRVDDATWTVVGAHMPNSWRGWTKNHDGRKPALKRSASGSPHSTPPKGS